MAGKQTPHRLGPQEIVGDCIDRSTPSVSPEVSSPLLIIPPPTRFVGLVLAGGRSLRMGLDKARLRVKGQTLIARQYSLLQQAGATRVLVSLASDTPPPEDWPLEVFVRDTIPNQGPLAGIDAAFQRDPSLPLLVLAVDLPAMSLNWLQQLVSRASAEQGVVPLTADGCEPLAAVYPPIAAAEITRRLASGSLSVRALAERGLNLGWMQAWRLSTEEMRCVLNWNHPSDWLASEF